MRKAYVWELLLYIVPGILVHGVWHLHNVPDRSSSAAWARRARGSSSGSGAAPTVGGYPVMLDLGAGGPCRYNQ